MKHIFSKHMFAAVALSGFILFGLDCLSNGMSEPPATAMQTAR